MGPHRPTRRAVSNGGCNRSGKGAPLRAQVVIYPAGRVPRRLLAPKGGLQRSVDTRRVRPSGGCEPSVNRARRSASSGNSLVRRGSAGPSRHADRLAPAPFFPTRSEAKEFEPSKPFQDERKIVARRRRRTNLCNKAALYQEYTWLVKYLVFEPRTQIFNSMPRLPHVQQRIGAVESWCSFAAPA